MSLIRREDAIDAIESTDWYHINRNGEMVHGANDELHQAWQKADEIHKAIESTPSAERKGEWIHDGSVWTYRFNCTNCGYHLLGKQTNYCPNCGCRNRKENE